MWKNLLRRFGFGTETATPISRLKPGGIFCVEGVAMGIPGPHIAPFSGDAAATLTVEQKRFEESGNDTNEVDFGQTFYVRDDTGVVRVDRRAWSTLRTVRREANRIPNERRAASLERFRRAYAGNAGLYVLERLGLDRGVPMVICLELVVPEQARVQVVGKVRMTAEPLPTGSGFPPAPATFREAPRLLELIPPDQDRLIVRVLKQ